MLHEWCQKVLNNISVLFLAVGKLLIQHRTDVVLLDTPTDQPSTSKKNCEQPPPNYPLQVQGAVGGIVNGDPVICGGQANESFARNAQCFKLILDKNDWVEISPLPQGRSGAVSAMTEQGLWVTGNHISIHVA